MVVVEVSAKENVMAKLSAKKNVLAKLSTKPKMDKLAVVPSCSPVKMASQSWERCPPWWMWACMATKVAGRGRDQLADKSKGEGLST